MSTYSAISFGCPEFKSQLVWIESSMYLSVVRYFYRINRWCWFRIFNLLTVLVWSCICQWFFCRVSPASDPIFLCFSEQQQNSHPVVSGLLWFPWKSSPAVKQGFLILLAAVARQRRLNRWGLVTVRLSSWKGQRMSDVHQGHGKLNKSWTQLTQAFWQSHKALKDLFLLGIVGNF